MSVSSSRWIWIHGRNAGTASAEFFHPRLRLLQPEAHVHLAVHRRRGGEVLLRLVALACAPVQLSDTAGRLAAAGSAAKPPRKRDPIRLRGRIWWIQYSDPGKVHTESSKSTRRREAEALYKRRMAEIGRGRLIGPNAEKTTYEDLEQMLLDHYRTNGLRSLGRIESALQHLRGFFSRALAVEITADRILRYIAHR